MPHGLDAPRKKPDKVDRHLFPLLVGGIDNCVDKGMECCLKNQGKAWIKLMVAASAKGEIEA